MKKIPFYNPASPLFFNIAILLLFIIFPLKVSITSGSIITGIYAFLIFSALYPILAIGMAVLEREAYINNYQSPVPEKFVNQLVFHNIFLMFAIYIFLPILALFLGGFVSLFILTAISPLFLFCIFVLPAFIRFILLNKMRPIGWIIIIGAYFFSFFLNLFIIWRLL